MSKLTAKARKAPSASKFAEQNSSYTIPNKSYVVNARVNQVLKGK